ncbi:MAG: exo-alpha-sialidase [Clostridia bacterium]|nr:exo-alpha-sialidase [Clostridia bacterium]
MNDRLIDRLSEDEKRILSDIYEPTDVAVPCKNPWGNLTVMRDGKIRVYGIYRPEFVNWEIKGDECYMETENFGLTWSTRFIGNAKALKNSSYVWFNDKYCKVEVVSGEGTYFCYAYSPDDEAQITLISKNEYIDVRLPFVLKNKNRIITVVHEMRPELHPSCFFAVLLIIDDFGKNFKEIKLPAVPFFEKHGAHKGCRWQQNNRENTIEELSDGTLMMISRTALDYHYISYSYDHGDTWTTPVSSRFHSTATMPYLKRLSDGRLLFFWCDTQPLPELESADGVWEDVFTNRDACHVAISEDDGKTWIGYRELRLDPVRNNSDFRSVGGVNTGIDKSVHQFEATELPMNKVLVVSGQHKASRAISIFDVDWLYEKSREEDFLEGLGNISSQVYLKSVLGGYRGYGYSGHCAYNRLSGAVMLPDPEDENKECVYLSFLQDDRLIDGVCGLVWNFPAMKKGEIKLTASIKGQPLRVSLANFWLNPCDETVAGEANASFVLGKNSEEQEFFEYTIKIDCDGREVEATFPGGKKEVYKMHGEFPDGLCYLHLQTEARSNKERGIYVRYISAKAKE